MDIPMGLVIEKWMYYYYPLLLDIDKTPQNTGSKQLVFYEDMLQLHSFYENNAGDGLTLFYHDLNWRGIPQAVSPAVLKLAKKTPLQMLLANNLFCLLEIFLSVPNKCFHLICTNLFINK
jgi:hypothetical protein